MKIPPVTKSKLAAAETVEGYEEIRRDLTAAFLSRNKHKKLSPLIRSAMNHTYQEAITDLFAFMSGLKKDVELNIKRTLDASEEIWAGEVEPI